MFHTDNTSKEEVSIPYALYQSEKGNYFIGQTPVLPGENQLALAALRNPLRSHVNVYVNAITVTNNSELYVSAEIYLRSIVYHGTTSHLVSCVNLAIHPAPMPKADIVYLSEVTQPPKDGVAIFSRIVSPYSTLVIDGGQIIISPGQSLVVFHGGFLPVAKNSTIVALGWWEEDTQHDCHC